MFLFPFGDIRKDSIIGIYGGGRVGASYVRQIQMTGYCKIGYLLDKKDLLVHGIRTSHEEDVNLTGVDCIVIAIEDKQIALEVRKDLENKHPSIRLINQIIQYDGAYEHEHLREIPVLSLSENNNNSTSILTPSDEMKEDYIGIKKALMIRCLDAAELVRVGGMGDGGYLLCNMFGDERIAYSIGIGDNTRWDEDMAERGFDVFMYDHTVSHDEFRDGRLHFFRRGLAAEDVGDSRFDTLERLIKVNGHSNCTRMVLKMDIEGAEWKIIDKMPQDILDKFDQIVIEFHGLLKWENWWHYRKVLEKIDNSHQAVHVHGNNACGYAVIDGERFPDTLEVTYIHKAGREFVEKLFRLPHELDVRNVDYFDEIVLGDWNKCIS